MPRKHQSRARPDISSLQEALQILPVQKVIEGRDKRSLAKSRRLIRELEKHSRPSDIAAALEIKTQKYVSLRKNIKKGRVSSSTLNDLLEQTLVQVKQVSFGEKSGTFISEVPHEGKRRLELTYVAVPHAFVNEKARWAKNLTPGGFKTIEGALNWYGNVGAGADYFWIVVKRGKRTGRLRYFIYDKRTAGELKRKGKITKQLKADKMMKKYGKDFGIYL